jgi:hypothetical protein
MAPGNTIEAFASLQLGSTTTTALIQRAAGYLWP